MSYGISSTISSYVTGRIVSYVSRYVVMLVNSLLMLGFFVCFSVDLGQKANYCIRSMYIEGSYVLLAINITIIITTMVPAMVHELQTLCLQ